MNNEVRIEALTCIDCLLFCCFDVTQTVVHNPTICAMKLTVKKILSFLHDDVNNSNDLEGVQIIAVLARFPGFIERIPCGVVINKGGNVEHFTYPIICHIYIGICVINEGTHLRHDVIPGGLHFGRD